MVYHLFAYGDGLAFGVKACTASNTAAISWLVLCYTIPSNGVLFRLPIILALMSFYGAFLNSSRSYCLEPRTRTLNMDLITQWLEPCSVPCTIHLTIEPVRFSKARIRLIVNL
jgi:hypothetical protein